MNSNPIGIFDSGIGGLTVAHAIREAIPGKALVYFGDTAHLPYGDKSEAAIQAYSIKISDVLLQKGCETIIIACNSASSSAYNLLEEYTASKARVINVIDPMIEYISSHYTSGEVGLIGTKRTIDSRAYELKIREANPGLKLHSLATPLLVPMIEEGFIDNKISHDIIDEYLGNPIFQNIQALILGCTHYPLIKQQISEYFGGKVSVLDSSTIVAAYLKELLVKEGVQGQENNGKDEFLVSDFTRSFDAASSIFFGEEIHLELYKLWE